MMVLHRAAAVTILVAGLTAPTASAATSPPHLVDGFGLTVVSQPAWVDGGERTFTFTVRTDEVPEYGVMPGQVSGEHVVMVTLPDDYDATIAYPVHYTLHGAEDRPEALRNKEIIERSTAGVPLITVLPNGSGRGWYTNWVNGGQNWENFHLEQLIPFVDANLGTIPTREGRAISGHSMGGFGAFHYAEHRPDLFSYVGSFSGGLDLMNVAQRVAVVLTELLPQYGLPIVLPDAIFGSPLPPQDGVWRAESPAQHVESLRGMGIAMYAGNGGDLVGDPVQGLLENRARATAVTTARHLTVAGIPFDFIDYGDGSEWAPGCTGRHNEQPCLQADMDHFVPLIMARLDHP
ncbi:alpha/beta hydrolase [Actinophytocola sp.]|uniref:alpha/beta hydrolase n=1 Tax=Actinophytocola sp. TaxID=1872138 RepID=UPI002ED689C2